MDNVSSLVCLKLESESEVLDKDNGGKDLFSRAVVPLNCDTPIIWSKHEELCHEETEDEESEDDESETEESNDEEIGSKTEESEFEDSEDEEQTKEKLRIFIGKCKYCLHVGEHISQLCPYKNDAPKNTTLGEGCMVVCSICCCLLRDSCCADCDLSIGCAILKDCPICGKQGEHLSLICSKSEGKHNPSAFT
ncbi:PREDICTED: LOC110753416 isoform [Prunus dulcis]|uniref:PREDICTED: LOC110753416 isoform n=1 Tax=Prunus dulcis TaxID=3755 RepID=A0A5E4GJG7_PRUDU|nr:uncharacterized protein LOC117612961 [Prunus dulcis]VVA40005.1 PREDICTED: LOC110753416 isoform [Prunus dulcis]